MKTLSDQKGLIVGAFLSFNLMMSTSLSDVTYYVLSPFRE
jgi:hypothetical protein